MKRHLEKEVRRLALYKTPLKKKSTIKIKRKKQKNHN